MRGRLSDLPLADLFRGLADAGATGALEVEGDDGDARVFFRDGDVYWAFSPSPRARLGARLVNAGFITQEQLDTALAEQQRSDERKKLGILLVDRGHVNRDVIRVFVQEQILDAIFDLMRWTDGSYSFHAGDAVAEDLPVEIAVPQVLVEVSRRQSEWDQITRRIPHMNLVPDFVTGGPSAAASLEPDEFTMMASIDGRRTLAELASDLGYSEFETARIVYGLMLLGVVDLAEEEDEADEADLSAASDLLDDLQDLVASDEPTAPAEEFASFEATDLVADLPSVRTPEPDDGDGEPAAPPAAPEPPPFVSEPAPAGDEAPFVSEPAASTEPAPFVSEPAASTEPAPFVSEPASSVSEPGSGTEDRGLEVRDGAITGVPAAPAPSEPESSGFEIGAAGSDPADEPAPWVGSVDAEEAAPPPTPPTPAPQAPTDDMSGFFVAPAAPTSADAPATPPPPPPPADREAPAAPAAPGGPPPSRVDALSALAAIQSEEEQPDTPAVEEPTPEPEAPAAADDVAALDDLFGDDTAMSSPPPEPAAPDAGAAPVAPKQGRGDVSEFLRELSRLALDEEPQDGADDDDDADDSSAPKQPKTPKAPTPPPPPPAGGDKKKKGRLFGWGG